MKLDFNDYQQVTRETAIYPGVRTGSIAALSYLGHGLTSEAGEVSGKLKKIIRDDDGVVTEQCRIELLDEVGDVLWYSARLTDELDAFFKTVATRNITKLLDRKERGVIGGSGDKR